jgi:hypothetical protein
MKRLITSVAKIFTCSQDACEAAHTHTVKHYNNAAQACRTERQTNTSAQREDSTNNLNDINNEFDMFNLIMK